MSQYIKIKFFESIDLENISNNRQMISLHKTIAIHFISHLKKAYQKLDTGNNHEIYPIEHWMKTHDKNIEEMLRRMHAMEYSSKV